MTRRSRPARFAGILHDRPVRRGPARLARGVSVLALSIATIAAPAIGQAEPTDATAFATQATDAYSRAMETATRDERLAYFRESERLFAAAAQSGFDNPDIEANLGTAALQSGRLGPAVLAFRRALLLDPDHARARRNLAYARTLLPDWVPTPAAQESADTFFDWPWPVLADRLEWVAVACFVLGCLLWSASIVRGTSRGRGAGGLAFALWGAISLLVVLGPSRSGDAAAVVLAPEVVARAADSINAPRRFGEALPAGTEVRIVEDRGGWLRIALHNGREAWVTSSSIGRVVSDPRAADASP